MSGTKAGNGHSHSPRQAIPHDRAIYITRLCLRILSLLLSIAVIAVLAHVMATYARTKGLQVTNAATGLNYPVWPVDTNLTPSNLLLSAACVCAAASAALVIASASKNVGSPSSSLVQGMGADDEQVRRLTDIGNISTLAVSITATLLWIAATVYFKLWDTKRTAYDLWSWVCMHEDRNTFGFQELDMGPLCQEMVSPPFLLMKEHGRADGRGLMTKCRDLRIMARSQLRPSRSWRWERVLGRL
jgi:hypothetical protein